MVSGDCGVVGEPPVCQSNDPLGVSWPCEESSNEILQSSLRSDDRLGNSALACRAVTFSKLKSSGW